MLLHVAKHGQEIAEGVVEEMIEEIVEEVVEGMIAFLIVFSMVCITLRAMHQGMIRKRQGL